MVDIHFDDEARLWWYEVDALNVIGTGCLTREDAERYALDAIEFALEEEDD
jgi:hypothetical protein